MVVFVAGAAVTLHFGFLHPDSAFDWRTKAGFFVLLFMLIPGVAYVLLQQRGAVDRLEKAGIAPLPGIRHAVGITAGQGVPPAWVFAAEPEDEGLSYYDDPHTRSGWALVERGPAMVVLRRGEQRMIISLSDAQRSSHVTYMVLE